MGAGHGGLTTMPSLTTGTRTALLGNQGYMTDVQNKGYITDLMQLGKARDQVHFSHKSVCVALWTNFSHFLFFCSETWKPA